MRSGFKLILVFSLITFAIGYSSAQEKIDFRYYKDGLKAKAKKDYETAISDFTIFLKYYPEYAKAWYFRGYSNLYAENYEEALSDFENYIRLMPRDVDGPYSAGRACYDSGDYEQAVSYYTKALDINSKHLPSMNDRGMAYCKLDEFDKGLDNFYEVIRIDSNFAMAYVNAGAARYFRQDIENPVKRDLEIAKDWFSQAIAIQPGLYLAYYNRAAVNYFLEAYQEALQDLDKALRLNPTNAWTYFYTGIVYSAMGNKGRAQSEYRKAVKLDPGLFYVYEEQARLFLDAGNYNQAIDHYRLAQAGNKKDGALYDGLMELRIAEALGYSGQENKMYEALKRAKKLNVFTDRKVYQDFLRSEAFKPYRRDKPFEQFTKSLQKIKKESRFLNPELRWFRMNG